MPENIRGPIQIHMTGKSAYPGDPANSYIMVTGPKPNILQRAIGAIGAVFMSLLPDRGGKADATDTGLVIETSPTIWEYEMFRQEWDRRTTLREVDEILRSDPRAKRANRTFAATAVLKGMTVTVTSKVSEELASKGQDVINQIIRDVQLNSKLASWARLLLKDGDLFLNPVVDVATKRITAIKRLPAISMQRNDDMTGSFQDLEAAFRQIDPISLAILQDFPLWSVNHIRWDHEEGDRYGNSQYLQIRGYWKKLDMTEQDLVIRRRTRAIPRRFHQVGNKDNPGDTTSIKAYKVLNQLNAKTSQITTDYYGNGLTDVKNLDGDAHLDHIKDIEHLQEAYMIGTGVPLHILGYGKVGAGADIIEAQARQFNEDTQELRDLLEYGDSSPYSGLRFIFDFGLALQGIDPSLVDYNIGWYADNNETADERVNRVVRLRSAQPRPLISQKLALQIIARDVNLENTDAITAELEQIESEMEQDRADQEILKGEVNPENPSTAPLSRSTVTKGLSDSQMDAIASGDAKRSRRLLEGVALLAAAARANSQGWQEDLDSGAPANSPVVDSTPQPTAQPESGRMVDAATSPRKRPSGKKKALALRTRDVSRFEKRFARMLRKQFRNFLAAARPDLEGLGEKHSHFTDPTLVKQIIGDVLDALKAAMAESRTERAKELVGYYLRMRRYARENVMQEAGRPITDATFEPVAPLARLVNPETVHYLETEAGSRITRIDETTLAEVRKTLSEAYANGADWEEWITRIEGVVDCDRPRGRAEMIARTELAFAYANGLFGTYNEIGIERVRWLAVMDNRTCERCAARNEQTFPVSEVDGHLPLHPRCRCTVVGVWGNE